MPSTPRTFFDLVGELYEAQDSGLLTAAEAAVLLRGLHENRSRKTQRQTARRELRELLELDHDECERKIRQATKRFRSPELVVALVEQAISNFHLDAAESGRLLSCAKAVSHRVRGLEEQAALGTMLSFAYGAWHRSQGRWPEADAYFSRVTPHPSPNLPPSVTAYTRFLKASHLRARTHDFKAARHLQQQSLLIYRLLGLDQQASRAGIAMALTEYDAGRIAQAAEINRQNLRGVSDDALYLMGRFNLAMCLLRLREPAPAARLVEQDQDLYRRLGSWWPNLRVNIHWISGQVARDNGRYRAALNHLSFAREELRRTRRSVMMVMASLDLLATHLMAGDEGAARRASDDILSGELCDPLGSRAVEALQAVDARCRAGTLTRPMIEKAILYFDGYHADPNRSFSW